MKKFVVGRSCRTRSHLSYVRRRILSLQAKLVDLHNKSGNHTQPLRKRSDFKQELSTLKRLHQEAGEDQLEPISLLEVQTMETGIEFFLYLVAMARILVVFLRIQRKSKKKQRLVIERGNALFTELWRKPQTNGFQEFILFCYR